MSARRLRPIRSSVLFVLLTASFACSQSAQRTVLFTSDDRHVTLARGMMFTLQTEPPPDSAAPRTRQVPPGQLLQTALDHAIKGSSARPGDQVRLSVVYPFFFKLGETKVTVPANSLVVGRVLQAAERDSSYKSRLAVVFDRLVVGEQQWMLSVKLVAIKGVPAFAHDVEEVRSYMQPSRQKKTSKNTVQRVGSRSPGN